MNRYIKSLLVVLGALFISCEDPIDVDLNDAAPRLVIEASLDWTKGTLGNEQSIKLSTSTPFFDVETISDVTGASVRVTNDDTGEVFNFLDENNGFYSTSNFVPILDNSYTLEVIYNQETYTATEQLVPVPEISNIEQSIEGGFDDEVLDVTIFFDDPAEVVNYYYLKLQEEGELLPTIEVIPDEFVDGNEVDVFFEKDDDGDGNEGFQPGDVVEISLYGISERYFNFLNILIEQYDSGGDPFSVTPSRIKGNCINETNQDNYAFGYFRVTEVDVISYEFQE